MTNLTINLTQHQDKRAGDNGKKVVVLILLNDDATDPSFLELGVTQSVGAKRGTVASNKLCWELAIVESLAG